MSPETQMASGVRKEGGKEIPDVGPQITRPGTLRQLPFTGALPTTMPKPISSGGPGLERVGGQGGGGGRADRHGGGPLEGGD